MVIIVYRETRTIDSCLHEVVRRHGEDYLSRCDKDFTLRQEYSYINDYNVKVEYYYYEIIIITIPQYIIVRRAQLRL